MGQEESKQQKVASGVNQPPRSRQSQPQQTQPASANAARSSASNSATISMADVEHLLQRQKEHFENKLRITLESQAAAAGLSSQPSSSMFERTRSPYSITQNELQNAPYNMNAPLASQGNSRMYPNLDVINVNQHHPVNPYQSNSNRPPQNPQELSCFAPSAPPEPPASRINRPKVAKYNKDRFSSRPHSSQNKGHCCSTCSEHFGSKTIFQCVGKIAHSSCLTCKQQHRPCGVCGNDIGDKRNFTLEEMLENSQVPCPNQNEGCHRKWRMSELDEHIKECAYGGAMACPISAGLCRWRGNITELSQHVNNDHPTSRQSVDEDITLRNIVDGSHSKSLVQLDTYHFLFHVKVCAVERKIFMAVQLLNAKANPNQWYYEIHVFNKREPRRKFMYVDVCHSNSIPIEEIFREYKCVSIPTSYAVSFVNEGALTYKVYIKRDCQSENSGRGRPNSRGPYRGGRNRGRGRAGGKSAHPTD